MAIAYTGPEPVFEPGFITPISNKSFKSILSGIISILKNSIRKLLPFITNLLKRTQYKQYILCAIRRYQLMLVVIFLVKEKSSRNTTTK